MMDRRQRNELDRHLTGNYGADQERRHTASRDDGNGALAGPAPGFGVKRSGHYVYICDGDEPIASMYDGSASNAWSLATTLAAAPELLTALETLGQTCVHCEWWHAQSCIHWEARDECFDNCKAARDAIQKARGQ